MQRSGGTSLKIILAAFSCIIYLGCQSAPPAGEVVLAGVADEILSYCWCLGGTRSTNKGNPICKFSTAEEQSQCGLDDLYLGDCFKGECTIWDSGGGGCAEKTCNAIEDSCITPEQQSAGIGCCSNTVHNLVVEERINQDKNLNCYDFASRKDRLANKHTYKYCVAAPGATLSCAREGECIPRQKRDLIPVGPATCCDGLEEFSDTTWPNATRCQAPTPAPVPPPATCIEKDVCVPASASEVVQNCCDELAKQADDSCDSGQKCALPCIPDGQCVPLTAPDNEPAKCCNDTVQNEPGETVAPGCSDSKCVASTAG